MEENSNKDEDFEVVDLNEGNYPALEIEEIELDEDTATLIAITESQKDLEEIYPPTFIESFSQVDAEPSISEKKYYSDEDSQLKDSIEEDSPTQNQNSQLNFGELSQEDIQLFLSLPDYKTASNNSEKEEKTTNSTISKKKNPKKFSRKKDFKEKPCPSFKKIPDSNFIVDGFQYKGPSCQHYFLSHFHSDHYTGLTKTFDFGKVYCSPITALLVKEKLQVQSEHVISLEMNTTHVINNVEVTLVDANHCPGAVMFIFKVNGKFYLHTGDFRYDRSMKQYPELHNIKITGLFLDNTFCNPTYVFPPQTVAIQGILEIMGPLLRNKSTLFLVGTYQIGKEKILIAIARQFNVKVYVTEEKYRLLKHLNIELDNFTTDPSQTCVHVVPLNFVNFNHMGRLYGFYKSKYSSIVGFQPTGWAFGKTISKITKRKSGAFTVYGVPYRSTNVHNYLMISEHSNYDELREFVAWIKPEVLIPTVDCGTPEKVKAILSHFEVKNQSKATILPFLQSSVKKISSFFFGKATPPPPLTISNANSISVSEKTISNSNGSFSQSSVSQTFSASIKKEPPLSPKLSPIPKPNLQSLPDEPPPLEDEEEVRQGTLNDSRIIFNESSNSSNSFDSNSIPSTPISHSISNSPSSSGASTPLSTYRKGAKILPPDPPEIIDLERLDPILINQQKWILTQISKQKNPGKSNSEPSTPSSSVKRKIPPSKKAASAKSGKKAKISPAAPTQPSVLSFFGKKQKNVETPSSQSQSDDVL